MSSGIDWGYTCQVCFDLDDENLTPNGYPNVKTSTIENLYRDENGDTWDICWECHDNDEIIALVMKYLTG